MSSASSGPLVFWRETGEGRRGLACHVRFCDNPECSCQEAFVQAFEVDERFHSIVSRGETLELRHLGGGEAPPSRKASAVIDLASGRFQSHREEAGGEAELQTWLRDAIDDKALSDLRASWSAFKAELLREEEAVAKKKWKERDWSLWDGEEPIAWAEIVAEAARERYRLGERTYEARDCYCIRPGCECDSITIRFTEDSGDWIGEVFLDRSTGEVTGTENRPGAHRVLLDLFDRYESKNDLASFSRRAEEMTRIGPEIHALRRQRLQGHSGARIGRNERCPCGSGKKFKNCCGR